MSLMSSLYVGASGLRVAQSALNTTAHNLANVDTTGYTRQQVIITDYAYSTVSSSSTILSSQVGYGTNISAVVTYRNIFLDQSYRDNVGREGYYEAQYEATSEVENLLGETEGVAFQDSITSLWESLSELAKDPSNIVVRTSFIASCQSFLERAQAIQTQLTNYQESLNTNILEQVDTINSIGNQIAELNTKISKAESSGLENANDYRDQRDALLDQLAQITKITYSEDSNGIVSVSIEGTKFVSENGCNEMGVAAVSDDSGLLVPVWPHLGGQEVYNLSNTASDNTDSDIGYLKGLLVSRGSSEANYTDIPKEPVQGDDESDEDYQARVDQYNEDLLTYYSTVDLSSIMTAQAQFDQLINSIVTMINDTLSPNTTITDSEGNTYTVLDTENAPVGMDSDNLQGVEIFSRTSTSRYTEQEIDGVTYYVYNEEDSSDITSLYTISQLEINQTVLSDVSTIPLSDKDDPTSVTMDVAESLLTSWKEATTSLSPDDLTEYSIDDYYTNFVGGIANMGSTYQTLYESQTTAVEAIDNERQAILGVSSDDELTNIIKYQQAYNAASRYITTVNDMLESLLNSL